MALRRALFPVIAVVALAGCGNNGHASGAAPDRLRQLVERHRVFSMGVPTPSSLVSPPKTLIIR
jgi:hypothetical protein